MPQHSRETVAKIPRYSRNALLNHDEQARLAAARVLIVGLGGLGGHVLDMLCRMGVGHITGADGDVFEASNLNRQLLCTEARLGQSKAQAAAAHVASVNSLVRFTPLPVFLRGEVLRATVSTVDVVVDALGGLRDRAALQAACAVAGKPLVSAGIAGLTGWVSVVRPGEEGPSAFMRTGNDVHNSATGNDVHNSDDDRTCGKAHRAANKETCPTHTCNKSDERVDIYDGVEALLGNMAPTVAVAAGMQAAAVLQLLRGKETARGMTMFDLEDLWMERFALS